MSLLEQIVADKQAEVARNKKRVPRRVLQTLLQDAPKLRGFKRALETGSGPNVIAEVKRASPSKGVLRPEDKPGTWQPDKLAQAYEKGGAKALSVLTDVHYFWGHPDAVLACKEATHLPVLRKDFVVDSYQVAESRLLGADAILLIARILEPKLMQELAHEALGLKLDVLVEVHKENELEAALAIPQALLGINNRDLDTLQIDVARSEKMVAMVPQDRLVVAESGFSKQEELKRMASLGVKAFLIGEALAKSSDPESTLKELLW
jgi:indole-3-glycerol phosphate synthase